MFGRGGISPTTIQQSGDEGVGPPLAASYLAESVYGHFANGGGPCRIVTVIPESDRVQAYLAARRAASRKSRHPAAGPEVQ
jgi:hypothetical protein